MLHFVVDTNRISSLSAAPFCAPGHH